jgi:hypothetical protein
MVDLVYGHLNNENFTRAATRLPAMASLEIGSASEADAGHMPEPGRLQG